MPDTVLGVAQEELANAGDEQKRARADLDAARAQLAQAEQDIANQTKELAKALDDIATLRQKIAAATNAAEGQALFEQLDAKRTVMRAKQAALDDAEDRADGARGRITALQIELEAAAEAEGAAAAAAGEADERQKRTTAWSTAAKAAPLAAVPGKADVTKAGPSKDAATAAEARLDGSKGGDLPADLFTLAHARRGRRRARLDAATAAADAAASRLADERSNASLRGVVAKTGLAYAGSVDEVRSFALTGQQRFDRGVALLTAVGAAGAMDADEKQRVDDLAQAATDVDAFTLQEDWEAKQELANEKQDEVDVATLDALAKDATANPADVQDVKDKVAELEPLQQDADTAKGKVTADATNALNALEAAVPDETWQLLDDYEDGLELLAGLAKIDPNGITTALANAEDAYAKALRAAYANDRTVTAVAAYAADRENRAETAAQNAETRLLEALRGDAY